MAISKVSSDLEAQKAELKEKLAKVEKQEKDHNEKCMILVGRAVSDEAESDSVLADKIIEILGRRLTKKRERELFGLPEIRKSSSQKNPTPQE